MKREWEVSFPSAAIPPSFTVPFYFYCMDGKALLNLNFPLTALHLDLSQSTWLLFHVLFGFSMIEFRQLLAWRDTLKLKKS